MNRKKLKALAILTVFVLDSVPIPYSYAATLETREYDYSNSIYQNGTDDTFVYDSNDSVITTKTGVKRTIPKVTGRYARDQYPIPLENQVPNEKTFNLIKAENKELMDNVEEAIKNRTLTKHIAADGQFYGKISDDVLGVEKKVYINTNAKGAHSLAVYVPAGEIATVKLSDEALKYAKKGKLSISVGLTQTNALEYGHNKDTENRMPYLGKTFSITENETKVGTPFGGMVYLNVDSSVPSGLNLEVEVTGAVDAPYFDLGRTTDEEWEVSQDAPGLFAEIRTPYLRFMIPSKFIREVEGLQESALFWDNATALSAHVMGLENRTQPMTLIFDPYITAGIAYASVGGWSCNLPPSWATGAFDYEYLMNTGSWGTIHEINHHYQRRYSGSPDEWGLGDEFSEITNNALSTLSYILYTNIAATRGEGGTNDWNKVADPYSSLKQQIFEGDNYYNVKGKPNYGNFMYSSFAHEIGPLNLAKVIKSTYEGGTFNGVYIPAFNYKDETKTKPNNERYDDFAYRLCVAAGRDYTWYIQNELEWPIQDVTVQKIKQLGYEQHIPVQSVYAMGELGRETGRPFSIPSTGYTFDFEKSLVSPATKVSVVEVSQPKYGTLTKRDDGKYDYKLTSELPENQQDEFILTVRVEANGIVQETKLNCTVFLDYNSSIVEHFDILKWDLLDALKALETATPYATSGSIGMRIDSHFGNKLARSKGYFTVEESGEYEFQVFGDDNTAFQLHLNDQETLESLAKDYAQNVEAAYGKSTSTSFTVTLEANQPYSYTLIANNKDGIGWADINIRKTTTGSSWQSITQVYGDLKDVGKVSDSTFTPPTPEYVRPHVLGGSDETVIKNITVLSTPKGVKPNNDPNSANEGNPNNIVDGDMSTYFHSSYSDDRTQFPHEYIFDLGETTTFNNVEIYTRQTGELAGVIGNYEIYVAEELNGENTQWTKIAEDQTRHQNSSASKDLQISLSDTTARYLKVKALNNRGTYNLTILAELKVSNKTTVNSLIAQNSSFIQYKGDWAKATNGAFVSGGTYNSEGGSFAYSFKGNESNIYVAKDTEVEISINGGEWTKYRLKGSLREPSLTLNMKNEGVHTIEVRGIGQEIALNMLSTDGLFLKVDAPDRTGAPIIEGVDSIEIGIGKVDGFDKLANVTVKDDYDTTLKPTVTGTIVKPAPGTNQESKLTYMVTDSDKNTTTVERVITVTNQLPTLTGNPLVIRENQTIDLLTDTRIGLSAQDYEDGDITSDIKVINHDNLNQDSPAPGSYQVTYAVEDSDGNVVETSISIVVKSNQDPIIEGAEPITIKVGEVDNFNKLAGVIVKDDNDTQLTPTVTGTIEKPAPGTNQVSTLTYSVTDKDGNTTTVERLVTVTNQLPTIVANSIVLNENESINLLTDTRLGLSAQDHEDGDITSNIKVKDSDGLDDAAPVKGSYRVTYTVEDSDENKVDTSVLISVQSNEAPIIEGVEAITIKVGEVDNFNKLAGVTVTDDHDTQLTPTVTGTIEKPAPGSNQVSTLTYTVTDNEGNTTTVERLITVTNQLPTLLVNSLDIYEKQVIDLLTDIRLGLSANDLEDGDLTSNIKVKDLNGFDPSSPVAGTYQIIYTVKDSDENVTEQTTTIKVKPNYAPIISGIDNVTIQSGEVFDALAGVQAFDPEEGELSQIEVIGRVDSYQVGDQQLTYRVEDSNGNITTETRVITVTYQKEIPSDSTVSSIFVPHTDIQLNQLVQAIMDYDTQATIVEIKEEPDYYLYKIKINSTVTTITTYSAPSDYLIEIKVAKSIQHEVGLPGLKPEDNNNSGNNPETNPDNNTPENNPETNPETKADDQSSKPVTGYFSFIGYLGSALIVLGSLFSIKKRNSNRG